MYDESLSFFCAFNSCCYDYILFFQTMFTSFPLPKSRRALCITKQSTFYYYWLTVPVEFEDLARSCCRRPAPLPHRQTQPNEIDSLWSQFRLCGDLVGSVSSAWGFCHHNKHQNQHHQGSGWSSLPWNRLFPRVGSRFHEIYDH
ncbi:hypothetical protein Pelo_18481 [Pelomyxa schiedti]|nr:hypothetical protein Pelo_18481 [Pelomyxa schiedti]